MSAPPQIIKSLGNFLAASPTPYHMCTKAASHLTEAGFMELKENEPWAERSLLKPGGKYFYTSAASTLVAFAIGAAFEAGNGFKVIGAHTDSPVLKVKPVSKKSAHGYMQVGVECYGGGLWHTWFDRDLSLAGSVIVEKEGGGGFERKLVRIQRPLLRVPNLCIHLQTADERAKFDVNKENHLTPILAMVDEELNKTSETEAKEAGVDKRHAPELLKILAQEVGCKMEAIKDLDLTLFDTQDGQVWGANGEFFSSPRLDNQVSCFMGLKALMDYSKDLSADKDVSVVCCFDHEEVGSDSTHGAGSPIMAEVVERVNTCFGVVAGHEKFKLSLTKSFVISSDVAHAVHPNYASKHESNHGPLLNKGTVIKLNSNQRYATTATTGFVIRELSRRAQLGCQEFVVRNDCPCGSTIGPKIAALTGIRTVDVGIGSLSMHSIRETIGCSDVESGYQLFLAFFKLFRALDDTCDF
eukprot:CAMPEP_0181316140 /NCGR_PEP_ID=MMETSP1101-20121128/15738_1 /TAXON_ID=46948 /ORGANISM="Rhodomonas abbreviata, Strain Caron Lab Isolate" /LENGTH=468 /DNA_ID=CAMNT_0023423371 /DNA_START=30 /DNA_END=1436 /DNA_ORIENTATION=+